MSPVAEKSYRAPRNRHEDIVGGSLPGEREVERRLCEGSCVPCMGCRRKFPTHPSRELTLKAWRQGEDKENVERGDRVVSESECLSLSRKKKQPLIDFVARW